MPTEPIVLCGGIIGDVLVELPKENYIDNTSTHRRILTLSITSENNFEKFEEKIEWTANCVAEWNNGKRIKVGNERIIQCLIEM